MVPRDVLYNARLSAHARLVWIVLQSHANDGGECWPSLERLAELTGLSRPTVKGCLDCLVAAGLVSREHSAHANHYRLHSQESLPCGTVKDVDCEQVQSKEICTQSKATLPRTVKKLYSNDNHRTITIERDSENEIHMAAIVAHYQAHIHGEARLTAQARTKITARLKEFTVEQIITAIDHFAADHWQMHESGNSRRGLAWWFRSEERVERYVNLQPRASPAAGSSTGPNAPAEEYRNGLAGNRPSVDDRFAAFRKYGD